MKPLTKQLGLNCNISFVFFICGKLQCDHLDTLADSSLRKINSNTNSVHNRDGGQKMKLCNRVPLCVWILLCTLVILTKPLCYMFALLLISSVYKFRQATENNGAYF